MRENAKSIDLSSILSPALEEQVKNAAEISMGTEVAEDDILNIVQMCNEVIFLLYKLFVNSLINNHVI